MTVTYVDKSIDENNKIRSYLIQDEYGGRREISPQQLKEAMLLGKITVTNLEIVNNEIVENNNKEKISDFKKSILKMKVLGYKIVTLKTPDMKDIYFCISKDNTILKIPDDVRIVSMGYNVDYTEAITNVNGTLRIEGGKNLEIADYLCYRLNVDAINISKFDTSNVKSMRFAFAEASIPELDLSKNNLDKLENMDAMFYSAKIPKMDLSNIKSRTYKSKEKMFKGCKVKRVKTKNNNLIEQFIYDGCGGIIG